MRLATITYLYLDGRPKNLSLDETIQDKRCKLFPKALIMHSWKTSLETKVGGVNERLRWTGGNEKTITHLVAVSYGEMGLIGETLKARQHFELI